MYGGDGGGGRDGSDTRCSVPGPMSFFADIKTLGPTLGPTNLITSFSCDLKNHRNAIFVGYEGDIWYTWLYVTIIVCVVYFIVSKKKAILITQQYASRLISYATKTDP